MRFIVCKQNCRLSNADIRALALYCDITVYTAVQAGNRFFTGLFLLLCLFSISEKCFSLNSAGIGVFAPNLLICIVYSLVKGFGEVLVVRNSGYSCGCINSCCLFSITLCFLTYQLFLLIRLCSIEESFFLLCFLDMIGSLFFNFCLSYLGICLRLAIYLVLPPLLMVRCHNLILFNVGGNIGNVNAALLKISLSTVCYEIRKIFVIVCEIIIATTLKLAYNRIIVELLHLVELSGKKHAIIIKMRIAGTEVINIGRRNVFVLFGLFLFSLFGAADNIGSFSRCYSGNRHDNRIRCEIYIIIQFVLFMLLHLICEDGKLSFLFLDNGLPSRRHISVIRIPIVFEDRELSLRGSYLFLRCRGAYLSHIFVFDLICHH